MSDQFRCVIHGSFGKHFDRIQEAAAIFTAAGIEVLAPKQAELTSAQDGFALFADEVGLDPRYVELQYLHNLKQLGPNGFSYFVDPDGYIGSSASYELGIAQLTNTRCFFSHRIQDHPAYTDTAAVWSPASLANYIINQGTLPLPQVAADEAKIHQLWIDLMVPGSVIATGAIIEFQSPRSQPENEVLLVKTHKWGGRYSIVGGKVRRNERLEAALLREVREETALRGQVGRHLCTFDQLKNSGYYQQGMQHVFIDNVVTVTSKRVQLNDEAQSYQWALPSEALRHLDIEPNARTTLELYYQSTK